MYNISLSPMAIGQISSLLKLIGFSDLTEIYVSQHDILIYTKIPIECSIRLVVDSESTNTNYVHFSMSSILDIVKLHYGKFNLNIEIDPTKLSANIICNKRKLTCNDFNLNKKPYIDIVTDNTNVWFTENILTKLLPHLKNCTKNEKLKFWSYIYLADNKASSMSFHSLLQTQIDDLSDTIPDHRLAIPSFLVDIMSIMKTFNFGVTDELLIISNDFFQLNLKTSTLDEFTNFFDKLLGQITNIINSLSFYKIDLSSDNLEELTIFTKAFSTNECLVFSKGGKLGITSTSDQTPLALDLNIDFIMPVPYYIATSELNKVLHLAAKFANVNLAFTTDPSKPWATFTMGDMLLITKIKPQ